MALGASTIDRIKDGLNTAGDAMEMQEPAEPLSTYDYGSGSTNQVPQPSSEANPSTNIIPESSGIINSAVPQTSQDAPALDPQLSASNAYQAPTTTPVESQVDAEQETVESRLNRLTAGGSRYINQARQDAIRSANARGLINSSIAAGAGTEAAIRQALPIAQQDARTYTDTRITNQQALNEFLKNRQSAELNKDVAAHENLLAMSRDERNALLNERRDALQSELSMIEEGWAQQLSTNAEVILNDVKFSDEVKLQYIGAITNIMRDAQDQITQIGMSDRTAAQQAEAIRLIEQNRDAAVAVYQDLLSSFPDWDWSLDFSIGEQIAETTPEPAPAPAPTNSTNTNVDLGNWQGG